MGTPSAVTLHCVTGKFNKTAFEHGPCPVDLAEQGENGWKIPSLNQNPAGRTTNDNEEGTTPHHMAPRMTTKLKASGSLLDPFLFEPVVGVACSIIPNRLLCAGLSRQCWRPPMGSKEMSKAGSGCISIRQL